MQLSVKLICRTNRVHEVGTSTIFVQYCYGEKKVLLHTKIKVPPPYWNKAQACIADDLPPENGSAENLNASLLRMHSVVNALALKAKKLKRSERGAFIKASFSTHLSVETIMEKMEKKEKRAAG